MAVISGIKPATVGNWVVLTWESTCVQLPRCRSGEIWIRGKANDDEIGTCDGEVARSVGPRFGPEVDTCCCEVAGVASDCAAAIASIALSKALKLVSTTSGSGI